MFSAVAISATIIHFTCGLHTVSRVLGSVKCESGWNAVPLHHRVIPARADHVSREADAHALCVHRAFAMKLDRRRMATTGGTRHRRGKT